MEKMIIRFSTGETEMAYIFFHIEKIGCLDDIIIVAIEKNILCFYVCVFFFISSLKCIKIPSITWNSP